jgi:hypothetical protein
VGCDEGLKAEVDLPKLFRPGKEERCERTPRTTQRRGPQALLLVNYQKFRVGVAVCPRVQSSGRVMRGGSGSSRAMNDGTFMVGFKTNLDSLGGQTSIVIAMRPVSTAERLEGFWPASLAGNNDAGEAG